jgi:hypothetical protein
VISAAWGTLGRLTRSQWARTLVALVLLSGLVARAASAQTPPAATSPPQTSQAPAEARGSTAPEAVYSGAAVVATGFNIAGREVLCGVGEIVGFFTLAVIRLPVWAVTLGDRYGSSKPLDRLGNSIIEKTCEGPWIVTTEQVKALAQPLEGRATSGPAAITPGSDGP